MAEDIWQSSGINSRFTLLAKKKIVMGRISRADTAIYMQHMVENCLTA